MEAEKDIQTELKEWAPTLAGIGRDNVFSVPPGYFEGLAANILYTVQGTQEPREVPAGYFDGLADSIMSKIKAQDTVEEPLSPTLQSLRHTNVFTVPEGYFEQLADSTLMAAQNEETPLSGTLQNLQPINVYTVPTGYFDGVANAVMAKVQPQPAKVVQINWRSRILKYAAAAVVTGAMAIGVYQFAGNKAATAVLTDVQKNGIAISKDDTQYNKEFEKLTDEDIVQFLTDSGQDVDAALTASLVDEQELPGEEDYLLDENTLDNFLNNNISTKNLHN